MRAPNLDQLRSLAVLAAAGSFSAAARRLNLTQPAVSRQIRELEKRFGTRLIERSGRHMRPTQAGERLLQQMHRIDAAIADVMAVMAPFREEGAGRVAIGTGGTACIYLLPPILQALRRRFPKLQIVVHTGNTADIVRLIEDNVIDLGLVTAPVQSRALAVTPALDDEQVAIFPRKGFAVPKRASAEALAELPLLLYEQGGNTRRVIDDWFRREGLEARPVMELGSIEAIAELVNAGLGCAVIPQMAAARHGKRFIVRSLSPPIRRNLVIAMRRDKILTGGLRHLLAALKSSR